MREAACGVATCISDGISVKSLETFVQTTAVVHKGRKKWINIAIAIVV